MTASGNLILIVDDTEAIRYATAHTLRRAGFAVIEAGDGATALRLVRERRPALVLLDVKLPDMDGREVCRRIKAEFPQKLVVQISASYAHSADRVRGLDSGADAYLTRPMEPEELVATINAMMRLRRAEENARQSDERYRLILQSAQDYAIFTTDAAGRVTSWHAGARQVLGYEEAEVLGRPAEDFLLAEDRGSPVLAEERGRAVATGRADAERWYRRRDGARVWLSGSLMRLRDSHGEPLGFLTILRDRTAEKRAEDALRRMNETLEARVAERTGQLDEAVQRLRQEMEVRRRAEEQLRHAQKMEAVGQLTGGIAHDFNNLLTAIMGALELTLQRVEDPRVRQLLDMAMQAARRGGGLTGQLLAFARKQHLSLRVLDLNALLGGLEDLLARTIGTAVDLEVRPQEGLWPVKGDVNQIESAVLNLAINARDAMPEGGRLVIETRNLAEGDPSRPASLGTGDYVCIGVVDSGGGMSEEVLARAFEPFFTTKAVGKGTGLGLSMVYGVAKQLGGEVQIESHEGLGTAVRLYLPRAAGEAVAVARPATAARIALDADTHILVVDDDYGVRSFVAESLRQIGPRVTEARDGTEALRVLEGDERIDLLVVDFAMPGLNGEEIATLARKLRPGLPALVVTGYADLDALTRLSASFRILRKPFDHADLAAAVQEALAQR